MNIPFVALLDVFFFFNDTATTEIYTLSLHDALPIRVSSQAFVHSGSQCHVLVSCPRSEEHTSELQSRPHLVCRLLLEKKNKARYEFSSLKQKRRKSNFKLHWLAD